jgi:Pup amidohydrolase
VKRVFGIETEYGIFVEGKDPSDLIQESIAVVRSYQGPVAGPWDYRGEDARRDMRGFRVSHLNHNPDDARYDRPAEKPMSVQDERADRVLGNGARLYNDHGHPEYSTPECSTLRELVAHDRAGERIVASCAALRSAAGTPVSIYKNNSDFHGMSYGCHESYLFPRQIPFETVLQGMLPFLVTRQIFAGAGKVGAEIRPSAVPLFQLSQRADFFTVEASVDTLYQRPIFNTRDEPHADAREFRRIHVICGDANLSEYATALKVGTTAICLELIASGWTPPFTLENPVAAIQNLSRDQSWQWFVNLEGHQSLRGTEIQREYLTAARALADQAGEVDEDTEWVLKEWGEVLELLETDPMQLADRLDWVAKRSLLEGFLEEEGLDFSAELAQSLDLEYSNVNPEEGLFYGLQAMDAVRRLVTEQEIQDAVRNPPQTTRAWVRGEIIRRFPEAVKSATWNKMTLESEEQTTLLNLNGLAGGLRDELRERLEGLASLTDWVSLIQRETECNNDR